MVLGAILRYAQRRELITTNPIDGVERHPVRYSGGTRARRSTPSSAAPPTTRTPPSSSPPRSPASDAANCSPGAGATSTSPAKPSVCAATSPTARSSLQVGQGPRRAHGRRSRALRGSPSARCRPATRTWSSPHPSAATSTRARYGDASSTRPDAPGTHAAVPFAAPLLRLDGRQHGLARASPGVDGPRSHPDHRPIPPPPHRARRRNAAGEGSHAKRPSVIRTRRNTPRANRYRSRTPGGRTAAACPPAGRGQPTSPRRPIAVPAMPTAPRPPQR